MTGKDLLIGLGDISQNYYEEAETGTIISPRKPLRRPLLVAAIIALALLLVGCAVVYVLKMQNLNLGKNNVTYDAYDYNTMEYLGKETYTEQVFTLAGWKGSPGYQAALEWFTFRQNYDPDHTIQASVWGNYPEFPAEYGSYGLYSQEMKDKLDEILTAHHLKPLGAPLNFRNTRNMCAALGIARLQTTENAVTVRVNSGGCYENGNFHLNLDIQLPEAAENELDTTWGVLRWNRNDCFSSDVITIANQTDWREWQYTTTSGTKVLIIRADSDWRGYILCSREEGLLSLQVESRRDLWNEKDGEVWAEELFLTDRQMEQIADAIDFGIRPRVATREDVTNQPPISSEATQDGYTVQIKSIQTDGWVARIIVGITAPEGSVISHNPHPGFEKETYHISPSNHDNFECQTGNAVASSGGWNLIDDGDGLENTQDIVMVKSVHMEDGSAPFAPGMVWNLYFADIVGSYWDKTYTTHVDILAEGEWLFPITFGEPIGDYTERELVSEPVNVGVSVGWRPDGTDVVETVQVTSFTLRRFSATIIHNGSAGTDFSSLNGEFLRVVLADGSQIQLCGSGGSLYETDTPIAIDKVDYIIFADGTKLEVSSPENDLAIEFITEPITVKFASGYVEDANENREYLYESFELTSVLLYPTGAAIEGYAGMDSRNSTIQVFLKDGSSITLYGSHGGPNARDLPESKLIANSPIVLEQVSYLLFPDGTKMIAPENK